MQAITTKYHGPGNVRGARISATSESGKRVMISYPHDSTSDDAHWLAAQALCRKLGWTGTMVEGATKTGAVFVFLDDRYIRKISEV